MSVSDPIADMLTKVRNAVQARHENVDVPTSKLKLEIVKILKTEGYIKNFKKVQEENKNLIRINQDEEGRPPMVVFNYNEGKRLGLVKVLSGNEFAVMLVNLDDSPSGMHMWLEDIGLPAAAHKGLRLKDAFTDEDCGVIKEKLCREVAPHDCALYLAKIVDV